MTQHNRILKIAATAAGAGLTGVATYLNAEAIALSEGWLSPLTIGTILLTVSGALALPLAEYAHKSGQWLKAAFLVLFFGLVLVGSLMNTLARTASFRDGQVATGVAANANAVLAAEAYKSAQRIVADECKRRGPLCRAAEAAETKARLDLVSTAPPKPADPAAQRLSAIFGMSEGAVALYVPLILPTALELGGFLLLALGLAGGTPARPTHQEPPEVVVEPHVEAMTQLRTIAATAKPKSGSREWYMIRLRADHPHLAARVDSGELSCNKASIAAGLRKARKAKYHWSTMENA